MPEWALIVQQTPLSDEQRPAVIARGDVAVTAGAGAGKTRTLVARYLSLLDEGLSPRQVAAITFTKKAAREMRNRVREEVNRFLREADLSSAERARWQDAHSALDAARIGTIHSLCGEILRRHPAEAGLDPRFEMLDEGQMALLQAQAVEEALVWAADDADAARLYGLWTERELRQRLSDLVRQRLDVDDALAHLPALDAELRAHWEAQIEAGRAAARTALLADPAFEAALELVRQAQPLRPDDKLALQVQAILAELGEYGAPSAEALAVLDTIRLNVGSAAAWGGKEALAELKGALGALRDLWRAQQEWLALAWNEADQALLEHYGALRALYDRATARYEALKDELPALDFDDLEARAVGLLETRQDVASSWQSEIAALLVDEFQDTNRRQRALLDRLNVTSPGGKAGKLFIVGDGKQSIYRFRGADVSVFRAKEREIRARGQTYTLSTSYRGHAALIEALNALLEPVLGSEEDAARPYVEPFSPIDAYREEPCYGLRAPYVELHLALGSKSDGALDVAAQALAARLVELVEGHPKLNYDDVALLCRATRSFPAYERALEAAGVPFVTVAGRGFYERPEVRDLLNALQALDDPTDDLALAGLLRSPACGLSDMALLRLVDLRRARELPSLWDALCAAESVVKDGGTSPLAEEAGRAARALALIGALHELVGRVPVADVLKELLDATAYRAALLRAGQARGARNVTKLLSDAQKSERVSVGAFLDYLAQLRDVGTREGEASALSQGAVQIMSVHAAKGLEFPIVCIGDAGRDSPQIKGTVVDAALGALPPLSLESLGVDEKGRDAVVKIEPALYQLALRSVRDQDEAESGRLLYVAATRAQEMLLISGVVGRSASGWLKRLGAALPLDAFFKGADAEGSAVLRETWSLGEQPVACALYPQNVELALPRAAARPLPAPALPAVPPLLRPLAAETVQVDEEAREQGRDSPRRVWRVVPPEDKARAPAWVVGQLVHGALADWLFPGGEGRDYTTWAAAEARGYGITDDGEVRNAVQRAARMLARFQGTALYGRMEAAEARRHEVPYSLIDGEGRLDKGIMDALFREAGEWTVVEFKTDWVEDEAALEERLGEADYVAQVGRYLDAGERLLGARPRPVLCLLNYGGRVRLVEDRW